jgi:hypothetical protein
VTTSPEQEAAGQELPEPSFRILVAQLATQALMELGEMPNPVTGKTSPSRARARFTIDLLEIIREKTRGNLAPEEDTFLERALYDLKLRFARLVG